MKLVFEIEGFGTITKDECSPGMSVLRRIIARSRNERVFGTKRVDGRMCQVFSGPSRR